jgi:hypothetical protein
MIINFVDKNTTLRFIFSQSDRDSDDEDMKVEPAQEQLPSALRAQLKESFSILGTLQFAIAALRAFSSEPLRWQMHTRCTIYDLTIIFWHFPSIFHNCRQSR